MFKDLISSQNMMWLIAAIAVAGLVVAIVALTSGPPSDSVETRDLQDAAVTTAKLADGSVTAAKFAAGADSIAVGPNFLATAGSFASNVMDYGNVVHVVLDVDIEGSRSGDTANDVIGASASVASAYLCKLPEDVTFTSGSMHCVEAPTTGELAINLYSATESTLVQDASIITGSATEIALVSDATDWLINVTRDFTSLPLVGQHLYLTNAAADQGAAVYGSGKFRITLTGHK